MESNLSAIGKWQAYTMSKQNPCLDMTDYLREKIVVAENLQEAMDRHSTSACTIGWVMMAFSLFGILSNSISIRIFTHDSMRCVPVNVLLGGLSCIDLFLSIFVLPVFISPALNLCYRWKFMDQALPYVMFVLYPLSLMTQTASVWVFVVITCERWAAVCRPLQARRYSRVSNAKRAFITVCVTAILYNLVRFGEFRVVTYQRPPAKLAEIPVLASNCALNVAIGQKTWSAALRMPDPETSNVALDETTSDIGSGEGSTFTTDFGSGTGEEDLTYGIVYTTSSSRHCPECTESRSDFLTDSGSGSFPDESEFTAAVNYEPALSPTATTSTDGTNIGTGPLLEPRLRYNGTYMFFYYFGLYLLTHFAVPFSILLIVNIHVIRTILQARAQRRLLTKHERREHRIALMMGVVVVAFLVCNTIPFAMNLLEAYDRDYFRRSETYYTANLVNDIGNLLVVVNSSTTSFIYFAFSERYRRRCLSCFCFKMSKKGSIQSNAKHFSFRYSLHAETTAEPMIDFYPVTAPHSRATSPRRHARNGILQTAVYISDANLNDYAESSAICS